MDDKTDIKELSKTEKMELLKKQLADLELPDPLEMPAPLEPQTSSDDDVEIKKGKKKERSPKQIEAYKKAQAIRMLKAEERRKERMKQEREEKKELEKKLIEKAIKVKKKQMKKLKVIDELSDDDTPIERKPILKKEPPPPIQVPKIRFV